jgi:putative transposase
LQLDPSHIRATNGRPPRRQHLRLPGYDYAQPGSYYVTIVAQDRELLFGEVADGEVHLGGAGDVVDRYWRELPNKFSNVHLDAHVVMPNHLHGIVLINESTGGHAGPPLPRIVAWFKTMTTNACIKLVKAGAMASFDRRLWQRGYYEHIVRNEDDLSRIRHYIETNAALWAEDDENPL